MKQEFRNLKQVKDEFFPREFNELIDVYNKMQDKLHFHFALPHKKMSIETKTKSSAGN